ncbi:hypothetical protein [Robiginitalea sp. IMCC43444]|uniref:hypothetical protein n=1 Tax=Robiginitalea sp. IMCC43444 TaxID=3459121 RepID=UPI0040439116
MKSTLILLLVFFTAFEIGEVNTMDLNSILNNSENFKTIQAIQKDFSERLKGIDNFSEIYKTNNFDELASEDMNILMSELLGFSSIDEFLSYNEKYQQAYSELMKEFGDQTFEQKTRVDRQIEESLFNYLTNGPDIEGCISHCKDERGDCYRKAASTINIPGAGLVFFAAAAGQAIVCEYDYGICGGKCSTGSHPYYN